MSTLDLDYVFTCFCSPVQAHGTLCGHEFYFRSRYEHWSFALSEHPRIDPVDMDTEEDGERYGFFREERYGSDEFAASYMSVEDAEAIIRRCAQEYVSMRKNGS